MKTYYFVPAGNGTFHATRPTMVVMAGTHAGGRRGENTRSRRLTARYDAQAHMFRSLSNQMKCSSSRGACSPGQRGAGSRYSAAAARVGTQRRTRTRAPAVLSVQRIRVVGENLRRICPQERDSLQCYGVLLRNANGASGNQNGSWRPPRDTLLL